MSACLRMYHTSKPGGKVTHEEDTLSQGLWLLVAKVCRTQKKKKNPHHPITAVSYCTADLNKRNSAQKRLLAWPSLPFEHPAQAEHNTYTVRSQDARTVGRIYGVKFACELIHKHDATPWYFGWHAKSPDLLHRKVVGKVGLKKVTNEILSWQDQCG